MTPARRLLELLREARISRRWWQWWRPKPTPRQIVGHVLRALGRPR